MIPRKDSTKSSSFCKVLTVTLSDFISSVRSAIVLAGSVKPHSDRLSVHAFHPSHSLSVTVATAATDFVNALTAVASAYVTVWN